MEETRLRDAAAMMSTLIRTLAPVRGRSSVFRLRPSSRWVRTSSTSTRELFSTDTGLILHSRSTDVYQNLALEDWIDSNVDLQQRSVLLLWRNRPAVVIGRHQNPWTECNLSVMRSAGIPLARRRSGGGTVFHDLGNLNLTFFTSKKAYDRQRNLRVVTEALRRLRPELDVRATERFDILLNGHLKISGGVGDGEERWDAAVVVFPSPSVTWTGLFAGSASRLSRKSSYHHCTLLYSADRSALAAALRPARPGIHSNATPSVPSPVANLLEHAPTLQWEELLDSVARQYRTGTELWERSAPCWSQVATTDLFLSLRVRLQRRRGAGRPPRRVGVSWTRSGGGGAS